VKQILICLIEFASRAWDYAQRNKAIFLDSLQWNEFVLHSIMSLLKGRSEVVTVDGVDVQVEEILYFAENSTRIAIVQQ
jgi:hypothetical protein